MIPYEFIMWALFMGIAITIAFIIIKLKENKE